MKARRAIPWPGEAAEAEPEAPARPRPPFGRKLRPRGKARPRDAGMNKLESKYEREVLIPEFGSGAVEWYEFEAVTLKLGPNLRLTPDFPVVAGPDSALEMREVKGRKGDGPYIKEDAWIKLKAAAERFPYRFVVVWPLKGGGWGSREV